VQIAQRFVSLQPSVIVPLTTPSAQTVVKAAQGKEIPVVFTAVSDPKAAHLCALPFVTGVSDPLPVDAMFDFAQKALPGLKQLGLIYNVAEPNSQAFIEGIKESAKSCGIAVVEAAALQPSEVGQAAAFLVGRKVDAIFVPNDNTVVSGLESLILAASKGSIPVIASDPQSVARGASFAVSYDQKTIGRQAGRLVARLLQGQEVSQMPIEVASPVSLYINTRWEERLALPKGIAVERITP
jgi:putative ABC transport system substrate-binding protein